MRNAILERSVGMCLVIGVGAVAILLNTSRLEAQAAHAACRSDLVAAQHERAMSFQQSEAKLQESQTRIRALSEDLHAVRVGRKVAQAESETRLQESAAKIGALAEELRAVREESIAARVESMRLDAELKHLREAHAKALEALKRLGG